GLRRPRRPPPSDDPARKATAAIASLAAPSSRPAGPHTPARRACACETRPVGGPPAWGGDVRAGWVRAWQGDSSCRAGPFVPGRPHRRVGPPAGGGTVERGESVSAGGALRVGWIVCAWSGRLPSGCAGGGWGG